VAGHVSGMLRVFAGQHDLAIEHIETSLRLSPRERIDVPLGPSGVAYFFKHRFDEAAAKLLLSVRDHPGFPPTYRTLAACYAHIGRLDEARAIVVRLRAITPQIVPRDLPRRNPRGPRAFAIGPAVGGGRGGMSQTRRLAAILAADVAGYSRLMGADEEGVNWSIQKSPSTGAASSRPPATACWSNLPASSMRCAARSLYSRRWPSGTPVSGRTAALNCALASNLGDVIVENLEAAFDRFRKVALSLQPG